MVLFDGECSGGPKGLGVLSDGGRKEFICDGWTGGVSGVKWYVDMGQGTALSCDEVLRGPTGSLGGFWGAQRYSRWGRGWPAHGSWWIVSPGR